MTIKDYLTTEQISFKGLEIIITDYTYEQGQRETRYDQGIECTFTYQYHIAGYEHLTESEIDSAIMSLGAGSLIELDKQIVKHLFESTGFKKVY